MIVRALRLQHGRLALARPAPLQSWRRWSSTVSLPEQEPNALEARTPPRFIHTELRDQSIPVDDPNHPVAQDYAFFLHQKERTSHLGSVIEPHYKPQDLINNPPGPKDITLELMMASQSHIGHATCLWNPANSQYIFGIHGDDDPIHIISLDVTATHLRRAAKVVSGVTERGGLVLFVGTREGQARAIIKAAHMAKGCHLFKKWIPGSITNGQLILGKCGLKVVDANDREVPGFEGQLSSQASLKPDLVVCLNPLENYILLHECGLHNIPTVGIIDTDANPTWVTYPIPGNDDSLRFSQVVAGVLGRAGHEGQESRLAKARNGTVTYSPSHRLRAPTPEERQLSLERQQRERASASDSAPSQTSQDAVSSTNEDLDGVSVNQYHEDEELLRAAESTSPYSSTSESPSDVASGYSFEGGDNPLEIAEREAFAEDLESSEDHSIDPSLLDNAYGQQDNSASTQVSASELAADQERDIVKQSYGDNDAITKATPTQAHALSLDGYNVAADAPADLPSKAPQHDQKLPASKPNRHDSRDEVLAAAQHGSSIGGERSSPREQVDAVQHELDEVPPSTAAAAAEIADELAPRTQEDAPSSSTSGEGNSATAKPQLPLLKVKKSEKKKT